MSDTVVIGGGPAGAAAAIALARAGLAPLLVERDAAPREVVCGEFLGPDAAAALARLSLDLAALGAVPLRRLRLGAGGREVALDLPFPASALPRRVLDAALRERAVEAGAVLHHAAVREATPGWRIRLDEGTTLASRRVLLATGKHALRGHPRLPARHMSLGLKLHLHDVPLGPEIVLLAFPGGYAGLLPTPEPGGANLCAALHDPSAGAARDLLARIAQGSALAARLLRDARPAWDRPLAVGGVPYGFRHLRDDSPDLFRLGDQLTVIPSFTGDGVAMALHSGLAAAEAIAAGRDAAWFHAAWRDRSARSMRWAGLAGGLLRAWPGGFVAGAALMPGAARQVARMTRLDRYGGASPRTGAEKDVGGQAPSTA